jgi:hypothetical protein
MSGFLKVLTFYVRVLFKYKLIFSLKIDLVRSMYIRSYEIKILLHIEFAINGSRLNFVFGLSSFQVQVLELLYVVKENVI